MKHRLTFTTEELQALEGRLVPLNPSEFDLHTFALLRGIYGRIISVQLRNYPQKPKPEQ